MISKNLAIMFTDMKGFTSKTSKNSRRQVEKLIDFQDKIVLPVIERFGGNLIKTMGDSYMVTFESPTSAVLCGIKIQEAVAAASKKIELRIAINTGDVNVKKDDVFGEPVNLASRLEEIAKPNEVFITEAVYLAMNKNDIPTTMIGPKNFKGIPYSVKIYRVLTKKDILKEAAAVWSRKYTKFAVPAFLVLLLGFFVFWGFGFDKKFNLEAKQKDGQVEGTTQSSTTPTPVPSPTPTSTPSTTTKSETPSPNPTETPNPTPVPKKSKHFFRN